MVHELVVWQYIKTIYDFYYLYGVFAWFIEHRNLLGFDVEFAILPFVSIDIDIVGINCV